MSTIYLLLLGHTVFLLLDITVHFKGERKGKRIESCQSLALPLIAVLFFVNDEMERMQMMGVTVASLFWLWSVFQRSKDEKVRHLLVVYMLQFSQLGYSYMRGTYSFDTSIKAGNKTMA